MEPAALACVECGTRVGQLTAENPGDGASVVATTIQPHRNTLSYQETKNERTFHASLTDTAMEGLGEVLGDFFVQRGAVRTPNQVRPLVKQDLALQPPPTEVAVAESTNGDAQPATLLSHAVDAAADKDRILRIFHPNGDTLELIDNRLKAKSGSDFLRRLTYLFLYAQELHGRLSVPSDQLRAMLESGKIWDGSGNARRWIAKRVGLASEGEDRLKLNAKGREEAVKTLNDALDLNIQDEWNPDKKTPRKLGPRKKA